MARIKIEMDPEGVRRLAQIGCTVREIAHFYSVGHATLERRIQDDPEFGDAYYVGKANLKTGLRKKQVEMALAGNVTMLIWLGKQLLGQRDKGDIELTGKDGAPLQSTNQVSLTVIHATIMQELAGLPQEVRTRLGQRLMALDGSGN
jgi:homoserine acetyltransferase